MLFNDLGIDRKEVKFMRGNQHLEFGIISGSTIAIGLASVNILSIPETIPFVGLSILGSLFPDIDHPESSIGKSFPLISNFLFKTIGHRTYTHMVLFWLLVTCGFLLLPKWSLGFIVGVLGHLYLDALTIKGVPFISHKTFHLLPKFMRCHSGSFISKLYTVIADVSVICLTVFGFMIKNQYFT